MWTLTQGPPGAAINPATGVVTFTADYEGGGGAGAETIIASVKGPHPTPDGVSWSVTIVPVAPTITSPAPTSQTVGDGLQYVGPARTATGTGPLVWSLNGANPTGATIESDTGIVRFTGVLAQSPHDVNIRVSGPGSPPADQSWQVTVTGDPTTLDPIPDQQVVHGQAFTSATPTGVGGSTPLTFSLLAPASPPGNMANDSGTGVVTWRPADIAEHPISMTTRLSGPGGIVDRSWTLSITGTAPIIAPSPTNPAVLSIDAGSTDSYTVVLSNTPNPAAVTWAKTAGPAWLTINASTGELTATNPVYQASNYQYTVTCTNAAGSSQFNGEIEVKAVAPVLNPISNVTGHVEGTQFTSPAPTLSTAGNPTPTFALSGDVQVGMTIDSGTGVVSWANPVIGTYNLTTTASNPGGGSPQSWSLEVVAGGGGSEPAPRPTDTVGLQALLSNWNGVTFVTDVDCNGLATGQKYTIWYGYDPTESQSICSMLMFGGAGGGISIDSRGTQNRLDVRHEIDSTVAYNFANDLDARREWRFEFTKQAGGTWSLRIFIDDVESTSGAQIVNADFGVLTGFCGYRGWSSTLNRSRGIHYHCQWQAEASIGALGTQGRWFVEEGTPSTTTEVESPDVSNVASIAQIEGDRWQWVS